MANAKKLDCTWPEARLEPRRLRVADDYLQGVLDGKNFLVFDGAMGTQLQARGLAAGELPELLCLTNPGEISEVHAAYVAAGADVVTTNTFGANRDKLGDAATVEQIFDAAVSCARASGARYVAADIGPTGQLLEPMGTLPFDEAYALFAEQARAATAAGADLFIVETMADLAEAKAALLAVVENSDLPVFATMTFEEDGRTFLGTSPEVAAITLDAIGADVLGINCSQGPAELRGLAARMLTVTDKPIMVQANAGLPHVDDDGNTVFDIQAPEYAKAVAGMIADGVSVVGGCCGTTPAHMAALRTLIDNHTPSPRHRKPSMSATSAQTVVDLPCDGHKIAVIGERINPTGKKRLQQALRDGDLDYVVSQGISQQEQGADILDVNVGLPEIDEVKVIQQATEQLQGSTLLPLQIDSTDPAAVEAAVRRYAGKPIINSVNGKQQIMDEIFPLVAHYGTNVVGLTLDEGGIPDTAEARFAIAERIVAEAARYGIGPDRILIDCLVMTASTNQRQAEQILRAMSLCKERLGVKCALGVSNISFGLPARPLLGSVFLAAAFGAGLDAPIMNPGSKRFMDTVYSYRVLSVEDEGSTGYIERYAGWTDPYKIAANPAAAQAVSTDAVPAAGTAGTDGDAAGFDPVTGVFYIDAACRHERSLRQGTMDGLNGFHAQDFPRENLDDVSTVFQGCNDAVEGRRPRHDGHAVAVTELNRFYIQGRRYDELGAVEDGDAGRNGIEDRTGADEDVGIIGILLGKGFDDFMSPRRRESQFNGRDATFDAGFGHHHRFFRCLASNDSDDADFLNFLNNI